MDEAIDLHSHPRSALARLGGYARYLDGLSEASGTAPGSAFIYFGLADCVCRLGHSSSLETLSHDNHLLFAQAPL